MPDHVIYFRQGNKPNNPANQTNVCDHCQPTMVERTYPNLTYDTEKDARTTFKAFGKAWLAEVGKSAWDDLWKAFKCTNQQCTKKKACGNKPTYVEAGVDVVQPAPGGNLVFQYYLVLAREIQCVKADGAAENDEAPEIPDPFPPKPRSEGGPPANPSASVPRVVNPEAAIADLKLSVSGIADVPVRPKPGRG